jgi:hypothetical protein
MNEQIKIIDEQLKQVHIKYGYVTACNDFYDTIKVLEKRDYTASQLLLELKRELLLLNIKPLTTHTKGKHSM